MNMESLQSIQSQSPAPSLPAVILHAGPVEPRQEMPDPAWGCLQPKHFLDTYKTRKTRKAEAEDPSSSRCVQGRSITELSHDLPVLQLWRLQVPQPEPEALPKLSTFLLQQPLPPQMDSGGSLTMLRSGIEQDADSRSARSLMLSKPSLPATCTSTVCEDVARKQAQKGSSAPSSATSSRSNSRFSETEDAAIRAGFKTHNGKSEEIQRDPKLGLGHRAPSTIARRMRFMFAEEYDNIRQQHVTKKKNKQGDNAVILRAFQKHGGSYECMLKDPAFDLTGWNTGTLRYRLRNEFPQEYREIVQRRDPTTKRPFSDVETRLLLSAFQVHHGSFRKIRADPEFQSLSAFSAPALQHHMQKTFPKEHLDIKQKRKRQRERELARYCSSITELQESPRRLQHCGLRHQK